jgi:hypothetical protein
MFLDNGNHGERREHLAGAFRDPPLLGGGELRHPQGLLGNAGLLFPPILGRTPGYKQGRRQQAENHKKQQAEKKAHERALKRLCLRRQREVVLKVSRKASAPKTVSHLSNGGILFRRDGRPQSTQGYMKPRFSQDMFRKPLR